MEHFPKNCRRPPPPLLQCWMAHVLQKCSIILSITYSGGVPCFATGSGAANAFTRFVELMKHGKVNRGGDIMLKKYIDDTLVDGIKKPI